MRQKLTKDEMTMPVQMKGGPGSGRVGHRTESESHQQTVVSAETSDKREINNTLSQIENTPGVLDGRTTRAIEMSRRALNAAHDDRGTDIRSHYTASEHHTDADRRAHV